MPELVLAPVVLAPVVLAPVVLLEVVLDPEAVLAEVASLDALLPIVVVPDSPPLQPVRPTQKRIAHALC